MRTSRTLAAFAVSGLALLGLSACGDDSGSASGKGAGEDTAVETAALSNLSAGEEVDPGTFVETIQDGVEASSTAKVTMTMEMGDSASGSGEGVMDYTSETPEMAMEMTLDAAGQAIDYDARMVDGVLYLKMGDLTGGKFWEVDPSDPDGPLAGMGLDKLLEQSDPIGAVARMEPAIRSVTYVGEEEVDGRDLDHYELTVDLGAAMEATGADLPAAVQREMPETITYDSWLDEENRFAQLEMDYEVMGMPMTMTMTADDWGTEVDIEAPSADEVAEMPSAGQVSRS